MRSLRLQMAKVQQKVDSPKFAQLFRSDIREHWDSIRCLAVVLRSVKNVAPVVRLEGARWVERSVGAVVVCSGRCCMDLSEASSSSPPTVWPLTMAAPSGRVS